MEVLRTEEFDRWLTKLRDLDAKVRIERRLDRIARSGNLGGTRSVGGGVSEVKLDFGPGYRLYFTRRGTKVLLLLMGGNKSTQAKDIAAAQKMFSMLS